MADPYDDTEDDDAGGPPFRPDVMRAEDDERLPDPRASDPYYLSQRGNMPPVPDDGPGDEPRHDLFGQEVTGMPGVTYATLYRALGGGQGGGGMTPAQQRAAAGSSQQWGGGGGMTAQQKADFYASYHPGDPRGAGAGDAARQQGQRRSAVGAGLHPDYGTPQGPELDPRQQQQLQDAEWAVQQVRNDPSLSAAQKVQAVQSLGDRIQQLDPAGRYRNGQQPMTAVQKAMAQMVHQDEDNGLIYTVNPKTGEVKVHEMKQEKAEKEMAAHGMTPKELHKMILDYGIQFQLPFETARQHVMGQLDSMAGAGRQPAGGAGQRPAAGQGAHVQVIHGDGTTTDSWGQGGLSPREQAAGTVQRFLAGQGDEAQARQAYARMHPDQKWLVQDAAAGADPQRSGRAKYLLAGAGGLLPDQAAGLGQPLMTHEQRQAAAKENHEQAVKAETARKEKLAEAVEANKTALKEFDAGFGKERQRYEDFDRTETDRYRKEALAGADNPHATRLEDVGDAVSRAKLAHNYGLDSDTHLATWLNERYFQDGGPGLPKGAVVPGSVMRRLKELQGSGLLPGGAPQGRPAAAPAGAAPARQQPAGDGMPQPSVNLTPEMRGAFKQVWDRADPAGRDAVQTAIYAADRLRGGHGLTPEEWWEYIEAQKELQRYDPTVKPLDPARVGARRPPRPAPPPAPQPAGLSALFTGPR